MDSHLAFNAKIFGLAFMKAVIIALIASILFLIGIRGVQKVWAHKKYFFIWLYSSIIIFGFNILLVEIPLGRAWVHAIFRVAISFFAGLIMLRIRKDYEKAFIQKRFWNLWGSLFGLSFLLYALIRGID